MEGLIDFMQNNKVNKVYIPFLLNTTFYHNRKQSCCNNDKRIRLGILERNLFQTIRRSTSFFNNFANKIRIDQNANNQSNLVTQIQNKFQRNSCEPTKSKYMHKTSIDWNKGSFFFQKFQQSIISKRNKNSKCAYINNQYALNKNKSIYYNQGNKKSQNFENSETHINDSLNSFNNKNLFKKCKQSTYESNLKNYKKVIQTEKNKTDFSYSVLASKFMNNLNLMNYDFNNAKKLTTNLSPLNKKRNDKIPNKIFLVRNKNQKDEQCSAIIKEEQIFKSPKINLYKDGIREELFPQRPSNCSKDPSSLIQDNSFESSPQNSILFIDNDIPVDYHDCPIEFFEKADSRKGQMNAPFKLQCIFKIGSNDWQCKIAQNKGKIINSSKINQDSSMHSKLQEKLLNMRSHIQEGIDELSSEGSVG